jgi:magnesium-transporting ATPase (P-type)
MGQVAHAEPKDSLPRGDQSETGLSSTEAEQRFVQFGPNEPVPTKVAGPLFQFLRFCTNPLVLILLVASAISAFLGQAVDAIIIAAMVVMSVVLNFIQAYRSERAVQGLRDQSDGGIYRSIVQGALPAARGS